MSKQRYNILRLALGAFLGVTIAMAIKDPSSLGAGQWTALGLGLIAAAVNYLPEPKDTTHEDRM